LFHAGSVGLGWLPGREPGHGRDAGGPVIPADGRLRGRVGLITGAASGIGAAGAELFSAHGAALVLVDTDAAGGERTAAAIATGGGRAVFVPGDAASPGDISGAVRVGVDRFGKLDLLWANAGIGVAKTVPEMTVEEWTRVLDVNLTGAFLLAKFGIPELAAAGGGTMVITGSANSFTADRSWAAYCASKGGLLMLCRALALDHADDGIRVNIVCPGSVTTPLHEAWLRGRPGGRPLAEVREADRAAHPLHRFADPAEVARAALFLSCAESSFTTGSPLLVDGGVTA
jgi:NAD(P)-dependent dehydrogenase (short-subunit alcohol dehydrogenase family)